MEEFKPEVIDFKELDSNCAWDVIDKVHNEVAEKIAKKQEDLIIKALEKHGHTFQNKEQLYEFARRCEVRQMEYDPESENLFYRPIKELWYENECIGFWDEEIYSKMEGNTMTITQKFAINPIK